MQEKLLVSIWLGSFTNSGNPFGEVIENNFDPSVVLMLISLGHQQEDLLKSSLITDKDDLRLLMQTIEPD